MQRCWISLDCVYISAATTRNSVALESKYLSQLKVVPSDTITPENI